MIGKYPVKLFFKYFAQNYQPAPTSSYNKHANVQGVNSCLTLDIQTARKIHGPTKLASKVASTIPHAKNYKTRSGRHRDLFLYKNGGHATNHGAEIHIHRDHSPAAPC